MPGFIDLVRRTDPYVLWVLAMMLAAYLMNQLDRYTYSITSKDVSRELMFGDQACFSSSPDSNLTTKQCGNALDQQKHSNLPNISEQDFCNNLTVVEINGTYPYDYTTEPCFWNYNGQGVKYQIIAGTYFILIYTFAGIPLGFLADSVNRKVMLSIALFFWSAMTILTGLSKEYWHLVVLRLGLGLGEAGCTPMAVSILSDYFPADLRGSALGVYNWGIYTGYSMSYALANGIKTTLGWRYVFYISGAIGCALAPLIFFTVKEPQRNQNPANGERAPMPKESTSKKAKDLLFQFLRPAVLLLCVAGGIRNAGGYVWALNTENFFESRGQTAQDVNKFMSWIPLVGGSLGALFGGFISDRLVVKRGLSARIWVLVISQVAAAPFAAGALYFEAPYSYLCLIPSNVIGEMWVGVTIAILVELVPSRLRTSSVAVYLFIISNIGGNANLIVPYLKTYFQNLLSLPKSSYIPLRNALLLMFPGMYLLSSVLFLAEFFVLRLDKQRKEEERKAEENPHDETSPLLSGDKVTHTSLDGDDEAGLVQNQS
ncbi:MFS-type efflux pump MSMEG_3705-like [Sycon ciliatum]|uniref:MFS-type efflux pump MSMEG_3705-like n=1 Tax=Sycon ciliatum TaxID=27933 RepID=UPI0020AA28B0|eukprot:scpid42544/ scgid9041/ D-galactonate transporter &gt; D-galactonate transporter